ncbi:stage II sporulation protein M [Pleomorphovibrio marinus]|uniref:stage II sporulation protein M n=1 Tax=Pleomorphovibrio marinus TaxID=2164132 RepID=UPI000E0B003E|nr:stage II sporulation protein M [Pleomorphovibrio marinus]
MREAAFVKANKEKWAEFENVLKNNRSIPPDSLAELYLEITDQLSFARTFFPQSNTTNYLNQLAVSSHRLIHAAKKPDSKSLSYFFLTDFPSLVAKSHKVLLFAFCFFLLFSIVGAYSAGTDKAFVRSIMGDQYVDMTLQNIAEGDPMGVYKSEGATEMFLGVTVNNIRVALLAFGLGITLGIGTLYILLKNAVMLGSFQYFFFDQGLFWESVRTIWIHGTIEIAVIIVAGSAGLVVGNSILFPGTYSRLYSFRRGVIRGSKIMLSTVPFFILAGFLEGFVTRLTAMPKGLEYGIICLSLISVVTYYVFYPIYLKRKL